MTDPSPGRILRAALAGLVPPPLREHVDGDPPTDAEIAATKETILARLDGDDRVATYWQLVDALAADHYTIRIALEELHDEGRVQPAAVFWRPDRCEGDGPPVSGPFSVTCTLMVLPSLSVAFTT